MKNKHKEIKHQAYQLFLENKLMGTVNAKEAQSILTTSKISGDGGKGIGELDSDLMKFKFSTGVKHGHKCCNEQLVIPRVSIKPYGN